MVIDGHWWSLMVIDGHWWSLIGCMSHEWMRHMTQLEYPRADVFCDFLWFLWCIVMYCRLLSLIGCMSHVWMRDISSGRCLLWFIDIVVMPCHWLSLIVIYWMHLYVRHDSSTCATRLVHMCNMTHLLDACRMHECVTSRSWNGVRNFSYPRRIFAMGWLRLLGSLNHRSLLQKSPINEAIFCKRDVYFERAYKS